MTDPATARVVRLSGSADHGTFRIYVEGGVAATIEHEWDADGRYRGTSRMPLGDTTFEQRAEIEVDEHGNWTRLVFGRPGAEATIEREGSDVPPGAAVFFGFGDIQPALLRHVLVAYDIDAGGTQTFPLVQPGALQGQVAVTRLPDETQRSAEGEVALHRWRVDLAGAQIELWAEADERVVVLRVVGHPAYCVRAGHEWLLAILETDADPGVSAPVHDVVVDDEVEVVMRDGVRLRADVYRPSTEGPWPTIVTRTPYQKELLQFDARYFARRGYAYVVQDVRGRYASDGEWTPFAHERDDGYDTIEWAGTRPWSNGKVGMRGLSYMGMVQWLAAVERPPHLTTIVPSCALPDPMLNVPYEHGILTPLGALWWLGLTRTGATSDLTGQKLQQIDGKDWDAILRQLPVVEIDRALFGEADPHYRQWVAHFTQDAFWDTASYLDEVAKIDIPVLQQSGWFDGDSIGTKLVARRMAAAGRPQPHTLLGPWGHVDRETRTFDGIDFGPEAVSIDIRRETLRWFDHWLAGRDNGIDRQPRVRMFAMGSNRWVEGDTYPLESTTLERWYLRSDGHANGLRGDGTLARDPGGAPSDTYVYDPGDPTPDPEFRPPNEWRPPHANAAARARRQARHEQILAERDDILVFTSEPLTEDTTYVGPIEAVIHAATSARDTDWFVTLVEVDEHGVPNQLVQGRMRARFRKSLRRPTFVRPGRIVRYDLDLWHTGITIPKGHRLRVEVASAASPMWARNLNTGGHNETQTEHRPATQTIHHSTTHPSYVVLPRVPDPG
mgnify:CR=1 FL=1